MRTFLREAAVTLVLVAVAFFGIRATVQSNVVIGPSMEPGLNDGQRLLISKIIYWFSEPGRGDVITFHSPSGSRADFIKRIIGLPGDTIEVKGGAVYLNGSRLDEPYIADAPNYTLTERKVPDDSYFVLGDNRNSSNDSHNGWMVPHQNIIGKAWLSIWPPTEWGVVSHYPLREQLTSFIPKQAALWAKRTAW